MKEKFSEGRRGKTGYGSSFRRGGKQDLGGRQEIEAVLGGQVWLVKPDERPVPENPCLWMQAGVVPFKGCNNFYDCTTCRYDRGMKRQVREGKQISWQTAMRKKPDLERSCRHSLTARIKHRVCAFDYRCASCDFDQYFEDVLSPKENSVPREMQKIKGFDLPLDYVFHAGHTWARIESGGYIRIGMDDFALKVIGRANRFELPLMGKELDQGAIGWGLKRDENLADVRSPVSGVIVEVNAEVRERPDLANREPYGGGWLFTVRSPDVKRSVRDLMADAVVLSWINSEIMDLENMIETVAGPLAADGGYLSDDIFGNLPQLGWKNLTGRFLKT